MVRDQLRNQPSFIEKKLKTGIDGSSNVDTNIEDFDGFETPEAVR